MKNQDRLDISIKKLTPKIFESIKDSEMLIEAKTDGIKLNIFINQSEIIFSYKNKVVFKNEFGYADSIEYSKGSSQFKIAFNIFKHIKPKDFLEHFGLKSIELFIEFLIHKNTLSSNYTSRGLVLLMARKNVDFSTKNGYVKALNQGSLLDYKKLDKIAKFLKIDRPLILFKGTLKSPEYINHHLDFKKNLDFDQFVEMLLSVKSKYGGKEEGVVIKTPKGIFKIQQPYQVDQMMRFKIKEKDIDPENEAEYWQNNNILSLLIMQEFFPKSKFLKALDNNFYNPILKNIVSKAFRNLSYFTPQKSSLKEQELETYLGLISEVIGNLNLDIQRHSKKKRINKQDDLQEACKNLLLKVLKNNNNSLVIGKFRILTNGHVKMILNALEGFDKLFICLVTSKDTQKTQDIRLKMLKTFIKKRGLNIQVIEHSSGLLSSILNKTKTNINAIWCGSDRVEDYRNQLKRNFGTLVYEVPRVFNSISATKVISKLNNKKFFEDNCPFEIWPFYNELRETYGSSYLN